MDTLYVTVRTALSCTRHFRAEGRRRSSPGLKDGLVASLSVGESETDDYAENDEFSDDR